MLFNILNNTSLIRKKQLVLWSMWEKFYLDNIINSLSRSGIRMHADISIPNTLHERWTAQYIFHVRSL